MIRIVLFLLLLGLAAFGAAWIADQPGSVVLTWGGSKATAALPVFALGGRRAGFGGIATSAAMPAAAMRSPRACLRSGMAIPRPRASMPMRRAG
jgi:uncharacterized membrane-anchored protein